MNTNMIVQPGGDGPQTFADWAKARKAIAAKAKADGVRLRRYAQDVNLWGEPVLLAFAAGGSRVQHRYIAGVAHD